jgi:hypothetical protein
VSSGRITEFPTASLLAEQRSQRYSGRGSLGLVLGVGKLLSISAGHTLAVKKRMELSGVAGLRVIVIALICAVSGVAAASARGASTGTLQVVVMGAPGAKVLVSRESGNRLIRVRVLRAGQRGARFVGLRPGRYGIQARARNRVVAIAFTEVRSGVKRVRLRLMRGVPDRVRAASGQFTPGTALVLMATDRVGVRYTLTLPADALTRPVRVTLTPLRAPVAPGRPRGNGVDIAPSGLRLGRPAQLAIQGPPGSAFLTTYNPRQGTFDPVPDDPASGHVADLTHFSWYATTDWDDADAAQAKWISLTYSLQVAAEYVADYARDHEIKDPDNLPADLRQVFESLRPQVARLARQLAGEACAAGEPDRTSMALAITAVKAATLFLAIPESEAESLLKRAGQQCYTAFLMSGTRRCARGALNGDGPGRAAGRADVLFAARLARTFSVGDETQVIDELFGCMGFRTSDTADPSETPSSPKPLILAVACDDVLQGATFRGLAKVYGEHEEDFPFSFTFSSGAEVSIASRDYDLGNGYTSHYSWSVTLPAGLAGNGTRHLQRTVTDQNGSTVESDSQDLHGFSILIGTTPGGGDIPSCNPGPILIYNPYAGPGPGFSDQLPA